MPAEQTLVERLRAYLDLGGALEFWRALGYRTLHRSLPAPEFDDLPDTAREPLRHAHLLCDDAHLRLCHLELTTTHRSALRRLIEPLYRHYPQYDYLFTVQAEDTDALLFVHPRPVYKQNANRIVLAIRTLEVQPDQPTRTDLEVLLALQTAAGADPFERAEQIANAFSIEKVTERFYADFSRLFAAAERQITGIADPDAKRLFTLKLFNRLLFVRFLERKGWLRLDKRRDYLRALWHDYLNRADDETFYATRLKPLFFSALNNPQQRDLMGTNRGGFLREVVGDVPYLNGGLFEKGTDDEHARVPDDAFQPLLEDLLYRYNFTITESTPLDIEVAVDPEMLGKVFEELVTGRHETGSYYTPRPVVAFMGREALKGYLQRATRETPDALVHFVDARDASLLKDPEAVLDALKKVRVCDPACGSGAYLLGMLHELLELRTALFEQKRLDPETLYTRKLEIIQNNLYGVDIDPFAVEIARLRLWLSLVVDDPRNPLDDPDADVSLPNLDFKIEVGDSLLAPDPQGGQQPDLIRTQQIAEYERLKGDYIRARTDEEKRRLRREIERLRDEIRQWAHPDGKVEGFDWRVEFAKVFQDGGFDIILANPPYVRQELIENKDALLKRYPAVAKGRSDLYVYFYARALQLLKEGGMHVFVCSNSWLDVGFGGKLQKYLLENAHILAIYDSALERQFASADVNTIISILRKGKPDANAETRFIRLQGAFEQAMADPDLQCVIVRTRDELWQEGLDEEGHYIGSKWGGKYLRAPDIFFTILQKGQQQALHGQGTPLLVRLGDIAEVRRGFTTGANEFFYLEPVGTTVAELFHAGAQQPSQPTVQVRNSTGWQGELETAWLRPVIKSPRELKTLRVRLEDLRYLVLMPPDDVRQRLHDTAYIQQRYPKAYAYIQWGERRGYQYNPTCAARDLWWSLPANAFSNMLWTMTYRKRYFVARNTLCYADARLYDGYTKESLLIALVNSVHCMLWFEVQARNYGGGGGPVDVKVYEVKSALIPNPAAFTAAQRDRLLDAFERMAQREVRSIFEELGYPKPNRDYSNIDPAALTLAQVQRASPDRFELDAVVFEVLGLNDAERLAVYRAVVELVRNRLVKARSV
jgi:type I restriction-modification system DNA methylase subunit